jgi:hypothetical protein
MIDYFGKSILRYILLNSKKIIVVVDVIVKTVHLEW